MPAKWTWRHKVRDRFKELGLWREFLARREFYRKLGYEVDACWACAERDVFASSPPELAGDGVHPCAPPEAFESVIEGDDCSIPVVQEGSKRIEVGRSIQEEVPLPALPSDEKIPPLATLSWVVSELGTLDPDEQDARIIRLDRRRALARAPSYQARWMFIQACTDSKMRDKVFDAWRMTLPSRQQIESSEKLQDDGRTEVEFADRALKALQAKKLEEVE